MGKGALMLAAVSAIASLLTPGGWVAAAGTLDDEVRDAFVVCELLTEQTGETVTQTPGINPGTCMGPLIEALYERHPLTDVVESFGDVYATESVPLYHCHSMFHQLGRAAVDEALSAPLVMGALWHNCGSGFMHGLFENMRLPDDPDLAGRTAAEACAAQEFADVDTDLVSCIHSVGHAIYKTFEDIGEGEQACRAGVALSGGVQQEEHLEECYGGLYMNDAEARIDIESPQLPESVAGWDERFPVCSSVASPVQCAINYSLYAVRGSDKSTESFLDWCRGFESEDGPCLRRVAFDLSTLSIVEGSDKHSVLCYQLAATRGGDEAVCRDAFLHASAEAGGTGALADTCAAAESAGTDCVARSPGTGTLLAAVVSLGAGTLALVVLHVTRNRSKRGRDEDGPTVP